MTKGEVLAIRRFNTQLIHVLKVNGKASIERAELKTVLDSLLLSLISEGLPE